VLTTACEKIKSNFHRYVFFIFILGYSVSIRYFKGKCPHCEEIEFSTSPFQGYCSLLKITGFHMKKNNWFPNALVSPVNHTNMYIE
jgi:phage FluMu protein Com